MNDKAAIMNHLPVDVICIVLEYLLTGKRRSERQGNRVRSVLVDPAERVCFNAFVRVSENFALYSMNDEKYVRRLSYPRLIDGKVIHAFWHPLCTIRHGLSASEKVIEGQPYRRTEYNYGLREGPASIVDRGIVRTFTYSKGRLGGRCETIEEKHVIEYYRNGVLHGKRIEITLGGTTQTFFTNGVQRQPGPEEEREILPRKPGTSVASTCGSS